MQQYHKQRVTIVNYTVEKETAISEKSYSLMHVSRSILMHRSLSYRYQG